jgi:outer membrane protein assembly factor BamB
MNRSTFHTLLLLLFVSGADLRAQEPPKLKEPAPGRRLLVADYSTKRIALLAPDGKIEWEYKIADLHDLHVLPDGNILFQTSWTRIVEADPRTDKLVWEYDAGKMNGNAGRAVEVHAFQRLADGVTMIAESGPARIIEVNKDGKLLREVKMSVGKPSPHRDTRLVRKLDNGNYLACHEALGMVREYDAAAKVGWEYEVPLFGQKPRPGHGPEGFGNAVFAALRLPNGNTLISTGNGHSILEVTPAKEIVWSVKQDDLPGIKLGWITTLQVLKGGNIVFGNCHAGADNPQIVEISRERKVVWRFRDFTRFGNSTSNSLVLDAEMRR